MLSTLLTRYRTCLNVGSQVTLAWCPARVGIIGNEQADGAAKACLALENITEVIPHSPTEFFFKN